MRGQQLTRHQGSKAVSFLNVLSIMLLLSASSFSWAGPAAENSVAQQASSAEQIPTVNDHSIDDGTINDTGKETSTPEETPPSVTAVHEVIKSPEDKRHYRYLILGNQLRLLLISDPVADKAAAALNVSVGHHQNPPAYPGLAHFLEHMLFLGTDKYPQAGEYQAFINQYGGRYNAYTAAEHTNYFFEIDPGYLEPAFDRFSEFFISPKLDAEYIERERHAVHAEYRARIQDDGRRSMDVYRELLNPSHPASGFTVGSLDTLVDTEERPLQEVVREFYQTYYSARLMTAVVLGRESLDALQAMAVPRLNRISNRNAALPVAYPPLFPEEFLPASVTIASQKDLRSLTLLFPIPTDDQFYAQKPFDYIAHLLGHEGDGSVFALLKQLGWAEKLSAGTGFKNRYHAFFYINIILSEKGVKAKDQIPALVLYMIQQLENRGLKDWRYQELQQMADINFRFQEKSPPLDTVRNLAQAMHIYEPLDTLRGPYLYSDYDEKLIRQSLGYLQVNNLLLSFSAPDVTTSHNSKYYQTPYHVESFAITAADIKPAIRKKLFFPEPNPFIPSRLGVKAKPLLPTPRRAAGDEPELVIDNPRVRAWFRQDQDFQLPKTHMNLRLTLPRVARDAAGTAQAHLLAVLVEDQLNEFSYPARLAGLRYAIKAHPRGLDVDIAGYSGRQGLLLTRVTDTIRKARFAQERFELLKAELLRTWRNRDKDTPYQVVLPQVASLLAAPYWNEQTLGAALEDITYEDFNRFAARVLRDGQLEAMFYGNIYRQEAIKFAVLVEHQLLNVRAGTAMSPIRVYQLGSDDKPWWYGYPLDHEDHILVLYVQALSDSPKDAAHMLLLRQILQPAFFNELRTQKQLGYVVTVQPAPLRTLEGNAFLVQSPTADAVKLAEEIDSFLTEQQGLITAQLTENQRALERRLREPASSLGEQAARFWESILLHQGDFHRREHIANAVTEITPESLREYYRLVMLNKQRRLWISSQGMQPGKHYRIIEKIAAYQSQLKPLVYP